MSDNREYWGGIIGKPRPRKDPSKHKKYGYTYFKKNSPPMILDRKRKRVAQDILNSLGKE